MSGTSIVADREEGRDQVMGYVCICAYICMYVYMCVCMYACMYLCGYVRAERKLYIITYAMLHYILSPGHPD